MHRNNAGELLMNAWNEEPWVAQVEAVAGRTLRQVTPLHGGMIGEVYRVQFADGAQAVAKVDRRPQPELAVEGMMLAYLGAHSDVPVPGLWHVAPDLLLMDYLPGASRFDAAAEAHLADILVDLHGVHAAACGFEQDTLIGLLPQPNPWTASWVEFFGEQRLRHLGRQAVAMGRMPAALMTRIDALAHRLGDIIEEPARPSLVHGDIWSANVLAQDGRITGVLDPAVYYGHREIELAYIFLFHSFGDAFRHRYLELWPLTPGYFQERIFVYQLYPLLSHVCHFGGHYVESTAATLARLGF